MKRFALLLTAAVACGLPCGAPAGSLLTNPIVFVSPRVLDFGAVEPGGTATNTVVVENAGGGRLIGAAKVAEPFKILSGETYNLTRNQAQVITLAYQPTSRGGGDSQLLSFSGGGGATVVVTGRVVAVPPPPKQRNKPGWR